MNLMSAVLFLFISQTPQDDYEKWEREHVTPTKKRIEAALKSDSKREWWEGVFVRAESFIHGGDDLLLSGGEFYEEPAKVMGIIGKTSFVDGRLTMTPRRRNNDYPERKQIYVPVRWGNQVLLVVDSEIELLSFCNDFNSGDLPGMWFYYATDHQALSFSEKPELPDPYRNKLLKSPIEYAISEVIEQKETFTIPVLNRSRKGSRVKVKFTEASRPYLAMQVFADLPRYSARGYVAAIGEGECEIVIEKYPHDPDSKVGEILSTKKPPSLRNSNIWWVQSPSGMRFQTFPGNEQFLGADKENPPQSQLLEWLHDDNRWVIAHFLLVSRYLPGAVIECKQTATTCQVQYAGITVNLTHFQPPRAFGNKGEFDLQDDYDDVKAQQKHLQQFWKSKLEGTK